MSSSTIPIASLLEILGVLGIHYWLCPIQQDLVCWNAQEMWCFGHAVSALSSPTRPSLLGMLRQCGVVGMQYRLCPVQQVLVRWNAQAMWCLGHAVSALSSPTSTAAGLLETLRQCGVLDMYSIGSVQSNKSWSAGNAQAM